MRARPAAGLATRGLAAAVAAALACLSLRRLTLLIASLFPSRPLPEGGDELPSVALVVAARNEAASVHRLLTALDSIDYPAERLSTVLVDDGSTDGTGAQLVQWANSRRRTTALLLSERVGKHRAQMAGMAAAEGEIVVFCDADVRPLPDCVRRLAEAFADELVAGAAALVVPDNASASPVARYAAVEAWVTQLVTSAGKDRLDLNPPIPGACSAFRRSALEANGWLGDEPGADVRLTLALTRAGWRTRFVPEAVGETEVVNHWGHYWHQHVRWARNLFASTSSRPSTDAAGVPSGPGRAPVLRRAESWMVSAGYSDRLLLLAALPLSVAGRMPPWLPVAYLTVTAGEVGAALTKARAGRDAHGFFLWTMVLFALDAAASAAAAASHVLRRPRGWHESR